MDQEQCDRLRARALFYWADSRDRDKVTCSASGLSFMLELDGDDYEAFRETLGRVIRLLPEQWKPQLSRDCDLVLCVRDGDDVRQVFEYWRHVTGRSARVKLTEDRRRRIKARLKTHGVRDLCLAADGLAKSSWHNGDNPNGRTYTEISNVYGNAEKVDRFIAIAMEHEGGDCVDERINEIERAMRKRRERDR